MKRLLVLAAAAAVAITATPALAKSKKKPRVVQQGHYAQAYASGGYWGGVYAPVGGARWAGRNDPSLGHPSAAALSRATGKCVEDLGYGRFRFCGW